MHDKIEQARDLLAHQTGSGADNLGIDPNFVAPLSTTPNYRLKTGSQAIDGGSNTVLGTLPAKDLVGNPREVKKTAATAVVDMGAYEAQ